MLSVNWRRQLQVSSETVTQPFEFVSFLIASCVNLEPTQNHFLAVSFVELTLWSVENLKAQFPFEKATNGQWKYKAVDDMLLKPTSATLVNKVKQGFMCGLKTLGLEQYVCRGIIPS